ncbi:MAG: hypothetical protein GEV10_24320 [Streptosporangiales bacterium]|nr:hypothetical protein [Streptosporangiales bacterium]
MTGTTARPATGDHRDRADTFRSVRLDDGVCARLDRYVRSHPGTSVTSMTNVFVDEALRAFEHPGIAFRNAPTGRRALLLGGPDVWEVVDTFAALSRDSRRQSTLGGTRAGDEDDETLVHDTAEALALTARQVRAALRYYVAYRTEVDDRIAVQHEESVNGNGAPPR